VRPSNGVDDGALRRYYAARAREYETIYDKPERQADLRRLERDIPARLAGRQVLEIACGTGYWSRFLSQAAAHVLGVDASAQTLEVARAKGLPRDRVEFRLADAYALPDELGLFEGAFAGFWWSHVPRGRQAEFVACIDGRLGPGARVVLLDNLYVDGSSTPIAEADPEGNTWQRRRLADGSVHRVLKNFPSEEELRGAIAPFAASMEYVRLDYFWLFCWTKP
jgi:demethylmenaquinone methyltransferase/2-methoxy-6-polyprenyl-1,4-benzoquinol methylase